MGAVVASAGRRHAPAGARDGSSRRGGPRAPSRHPRAQGSPRRVPGRVAGALIAVCLVGLACAPASSPSSVPSPTVQTPVGLTSPVPSAPFAGSPAPSSAGSGSPGAPPVQDLALLSILPATLGAIPVNNEPGSYADALADPAFVASVAAVAFPIVLDGSDLASGVVARLRPGVYSDAFYRDWRDTYDTGACAQAGGVAGTAIAQLGGRSVDITSCAGGLRIYHVYLDGRNVLISIFSIGTRRFGEQLMTAIRP